MKEMPDEWKEEGMISRQEVLVRSISHPTMIPVYGIVFPGHISIQSFFHLSSHLCVPGAGTYMLSFCRTNPTSLLSSKPSGITVSPSKAMMFVEKK